jgi:hypothetical protein
MLRRSILKLCLRSLLLHWQHENVDDDALELLEESNMINLRLTPEQARVAFCWIQVPRLMIFVKIDLVLLCRSTILPLATLLSAAARAAATGQLAQSGGQQTRAGVRRVPGTR